jgi:zinc transport system substrate-binding protein
VSRWGAVKQDRLKEGKSQNSIDQNQEMTRRFANRIPRVFISLLAIAVFSLTLSCGKKTAEVGRLAVVVSILPLADFVEQVGRDKVHVTVMVPPGASPHSYEPKPSQLVAVSKARMFVEVGTDVEFELAWMDKLKEINKDMLVVNSSQGIGLMGKDPHVWLSPSNAEKMVTNICNGLVKLDPANQDYYFANKSKYLAQLDELDRSIRGQLSGIADRRFIVYHPAWGYFARDYGLEQIAVEEEGKETTADNIKEVVDRSKGMHHKIVFVSPQFSTKGAEVVAHEIGGSTEFLDPLPEHYLADMQTAVGRLVQAMR